jgi:gluconokinase
VGASLATRPIDILRAALETVAYRFALVHTMLAEACPGADEVVATGGALAASPAWTQIMADVLGVPVRPSTEPEASSRGAALLALEALGLPWPPAPPPDRILQPDPERHARYRAARERQSRLYDNVVGFRDS